MKFDFTKDNTTLALRTGLSLTTIQQKRKEQAPWTVKKKGWALRGRKFC